MATKRTSKSQNHAHEQTRERQHRRPSGLTSPWLWLALASFIHLVAFVQLLNTPFGRLDRWRQTDMHYYSDWSEQIASGDWLSRNLPLPAHRWHHEVADRARQLDPSLRTATDDELWRRWMRAPQFYQDPAYAYALSALYAVRAGPSAMVACQLAVSVLGLWLIWRLTHDYFGPRAAVVAGALASLSGPLVFYQLLLLRDGLIAVIGLVCIWLLDRTRGGSIIAALPLGLILGAGVLLKGTLLPLAFICLAVVSLAAARNRISRGCGVAVLAGFALTISPFTARNISLGVAPLALASSGPLTFFAANEQKANPDVGFGINVDALASWLAQTDGGWRAAIRSSLAGHSVSSYLSLEWRKFDRACHWFEIPNNENFYYFRREISILQWLPITFWLVGPLGLVGLALAMPRLRVAWPLYVLVGLSLAPLIAFYVLGRFRLTLFVSLVPFAALTLVRFTELLATARLRFAAAIFVTACLVWCWTGRPLSESQRLIRTSDWILAWSTHYESKVYGALDVHEPARAASSYLEFFERFEPSDAEILTNGDKGLALELADMHVECSQILNAAGQRQAATLQTDRAQRLTALAREMG